MHCSFMSSFVHMSYRALAQQGLHQSFHRIISHQVIGSSVQWIMGRQFSGALVMVYQCIRALVCQCVNSLVIGSLLQQAAVQHSLVRK